MSVSFPWSTSRKPPDGGVVLVARLGVTLVRGILNNVDPNRTYPNKQGRRALAELYILFMLPGIELSLNHK